MLLCFRCGNCHQAFKNQLDASSLSRATQVPVTGEQSSKYAARTPVQSGQGTENRPSNSAMKSNKWLLIRKIKTCIGPKIQVIFPLPMFSTHAPVGPYSRLGICICPYGATGLDGQPTTAGSRSGTMASCGALRAIQHLLSLESCYLRTNMRHRHIVGPREGAWKRPI